MANQYGIVIPLAILGFLIPSSECVTSLNCGSSVATVNLNQVYDTYTYPSSGSYPTLTTCQWLFQSSDSSSRITFTVTNIYIHCGDVLKFYDGTSDSASAIGSSVCCSAPCGASKAAETTTGNSFFVKFVTDGTTTTHETGFNVSVVVGKDESSCATNGTNNAVTLTAQTALTSPQFPANYPVSHICTYTYTYSGGTVRLEFVYLNVELDSGICYDYVELYNGSSTSSPLIAKVCGDTVPTTIYISTGSALTVKFLSDDQQTKTGFYANVIPVDAESTTSSDATTESSTIETTNGPTTQSTTAEAQSDHPEYTTRFVRKVFVYGNNGVGLASTSENTDDGGVIAAIVVSVLAVVLLMGVGIVLYRKKVKGRYPVDTVKESVPKNDGDDMQEKNTKDIIDESEMESKASPPSSTAIHSDTMKI